MTTAQKLPKLSPQAARQAAATLGSALHNRLKVLIGPRDPVRNPALLKSLSTYASIIAGQPINCKWGNTHETDLTGEIFLNPNDPEGAPAVDRKIVLDAALEHEVRGHWRYTPREVWNRVQMMANGQGPEAQQAPWQEPIYQNRRHAVRPLFNVLEDGRVETRLRWESPDAYRRIAAADRVRPRWEVKEAFLPAFRAYIVLQDEAGNKEPVYFCKVCGINPAPRGLPCADCFYEEYRWAQISGLLLLAGIPPHTPPTTLVEEPVLQVFSKCEPWLLFSLKGTANDTFYAAREILKILIEHNMAPLQPKTDHLQVSDATGQQNRRDSSMQPNTAHRSGLDMALNPSQDQSQNDTGDRVSNTDRGKTTDSSAQSSSKDDATEQKTQQKSQASAEGHVSGQKSQPGEEKGAGNNQQTPARASFSIHDLAERDLQDYDQSIRVDLNLLRQQAQQDFDDQEAIVTQEAMLDLIAGVSGIGAGPGTDWIPVPTPRIKETYQWLEAENRERGRMLARQIREVLHTVIRPQRYQRSGRLDRRQLVNAAARGRQTVFIRPQIRRELNLAVSLDLDVSGSMDAYNLPFNSRQRAVTSLPAQLADAAAVCAVALNWLNTAFEVRAFGSRQWMVKSFYEADCAGIGGLPGCDGGGTEMAAAIEYSRLALLGRQEQDRLLVVVTDGVPDRRGEVIRQVRSAQLAGVHVLGVFFSNQREPWNEVVPAMAEIFNPQGYTVIHGLDDFPEVVGKAIKSLLQRGVLAPMR